MTANEVTAFARLAAMDADCAGQMVAIQRDGDGHYLTPSQAWSPDIADARLFDYDREKVRGQVEHIETEFDHQWNAVPVKKAP